MNKRIISWDLGATKCAVGVIDYNSDTQAFTCQKHYSLKLTEAASLIDLIAKLETGLDQSMTDADAICIGGAGTFDGQHLLHTNPYPFAMHFSDAATRLSWPPFTVIHDYASIVCATFTSHMTDANAVKRLNNSNVNLYGRRVAFGIGTGLGLKDGVLLPNGDFWLGQNEAGHIGISTPPLANAHDINRHYELLRFLSSKMESAHPITFEKILSGQGTARLHEFLYPDMTYLNPEEVGERIRENKASELLDILAWYIGLFVGTVQLSFMPEGGIWITGGVTLNHMNVFDRSDFVKGIEASPAYLSQRNDYPLGVLCSRENPLIGCGYYAVKRLLKL
jgi:glucokinase